MPSISPYGRCDFQQDESLGMKGTSNIKTKWPPCSVCWAIHRFVWHVEACHGGVRMMQQESLNCGIVTGITITAFMPARQREMPCRYVKLLMFLLFTSKSALTKSKRYQRRRRNFISSNTENKQSHVRVLIKGFRPGDQE